MKTSYTYVCVYTKKSTHLIQLAYKLIFQSKNKKKLCPLNKEPINEIF